jgi:peroxiredoxin
MKKAGFYYLIFALSLLQPGLAGTDDRLPDETIRAKLKLNVTVPLTNFWQVDFNCDKVLEILKTRSVVLPPQLSAEAKIGITLDNDAVVLVFEKIQGGKKIRLLADTNQNNDLTDEIAVQFDVDRREGDLGPLVEIKRRGGFAGSRPAWLPYYFLYFESKNRDGKTEETFGYGAHYCVEGTLEFGDVKQKIRIQDLLVDGIFDFKDLNQGTAIQIDLNGDGSFSDREVFSRDSLIPLAGGYYLPDSIAEDGSEITFKPSDLHPVRAGDMAPDIPLTDKLGKTFRLSDYRGRVVLLDFWASWCGYCVNEFPAIKAEAEKFAGKQFEILGINLDEATKLDKAIKVIDQYKLPWRQVMEGKGTAIPIARLCMSAAERGFFIPLYVVIDAQGVIRETSWDFKKAWQAIAELMNSSRSRSSN